MLCLSAVCSGEAPAISALGPHAGVADTFAGVSLSLPDPLQAREQA